jgi:serine phosphatase RsbU (regulator of sigma subunit)
VLEPRLARLPDAGVGTSGYWRSSIEEGEFGGEGRSGRRCWVRRLAVGIAPLLVVIGFVGADLALGPSQVVLGLVVFAPLLAASIVGRRLTGVYGLGAVAAAVLLGFFDDQYTQANWVAQAVRVAGVLAGAGLAIAACSARLRREQRVRRLVAESAEAKAHEHVAEGLARLAEVMQRSLLTDPPDLDDLEIAARYVPAAEHVKIGGDWYDVFPAPGGRTMLVIGDVAGHDRSAAAAMAAVRHMLRGISQIITGSPAGVLSALDGALARLKPAILATVILVEVSRDAGIDTRSMRLCWSNAGHPPPVVNRAGTCEILEPQPPDPLLGLNLALPRHDHELWLAAGDMMVMFTDGLVEERGQVIDDGLERVRHTVQSAADRTMAELCDALMSPLATTRGNDDAALLVVRARNAL